MDKTQNGKNTRNNNTTSTPNPNYFFYKNKKKQTNHSEHKQLQLVEFFTPAVTSDRLSNNHHAQVNVSFKHAHTHTQNICSNCCSRLYQSQDLIPPHTCLFSLHSLILSFFCSFRKRYSWYQVSCSLISSSVLVGINPFK